MITKDVKREYLIAGMIKISPINVHAQTFSHPINIMKGDQKGHIIGIEVTI